MNWLRLRHNVYQWGGNARLKYEMRLMHAFISAVCSNQLTVQG